MKIIVNARFLCSPRTGVQRFAFETSVRLKRLAEQNGDDITFLTPPFNFETNDDRVAVLKPEQVGNRRGHAWEQIDLPRALVKLGSVSLFSPANTGPMSYKNQVIVLHDTAFLAYPGSFSPAFRLWYAFLSKKLCACCRDVVTVSRFSKSEIERYIPAARGKITVAYNGAGFDESLGAGKDRVLTQSLPKEFILTVGNLDPRKNLVTLLKAYDRSALFEEKGIGLLVVGASSGIFRAEKLAVPQGVRLLGRVSDAELADLYSKALAFASSSIYEGFGLPLVEASLAGKACVVSDIPVYREVLGDDGALFVPPLKPEAWAQALTAISASSQARDLRVNAAKKRIAVYNWDETARTVYEILKKR